MWSWPRAHGGPVAYGRLRCFPEDFLVDENLGFEPSGEGEHWLVHVEKRSTNTSWVGARLAEFANVPRRAVSYSGLKDRHALARQWFSVHQPGNRKVAWETCRGEGFQVIRAARHGRKLRRGSHRGNRFLIRIRECDAPAAQVDSCLEAVAAGGAPNYFGNQRFGRGGSNLSRALALFAGNTVTSREQKAFCLSAARAWLFNRVLATRVLRRVWNSPIDGEVFALDGTGSVFAEPLTDTLSQRVQDMDLHPTGPMWGVGVSRVSGLCARIEDTLAGHYPVLCRGLESHGLKRQRRSLRMRVRDLSWTWPETGSVELRFALGRGEFATAVLRELISD